MDKTFGKKNYENIMPSSIDILFLGIGLDGHIASIFPKSNLLTERNKLYASVTCSKFPENRITITPKFLELPNNIFLFAFGDEKILLYEKFKNKYIDYVEMPVKLITKGYWLDNHGIKII